MTRKRKTVIVLLAVTLLLVSARMAMPYVVEDVVNDRREKSPDLRKSRRPKVQFPENTAASILEAARPGAELFVAASSPGS